jgi:protein-disulfide isomerase
VRKGLVRYVFRHFPVGGQESVRAAGAAECAGEQGKFWEYHDILFANAGGEGVSFSDPVLAEMARVVGLDLELFKACMESPRPLERVQRDARDGRSLGVRAVPTVFINQWMFVGLQGYAAYKEAIEQELSKRR